MDVHGFCLVHIYPKYYIALLVKYSVINTYIHCTHSSIYAECEKIMVRRMKAIIKQIESVVTPSGNSGHVVVPKVWIGKEVVVKIKQEDK